MASWAIDWDGTYHHALSQNEFIHRYKPNPLPSEPTVYMVDIRPYSPILTADKAALVSVRRTLLPHAEVVMVRDDNLDRPSPAHHTFFLVSRADQVNMEAYNALNWKQKRLVEMYRERMQVFLAIYRCPAAVRGFLGL